MGLAVLIGVMFVRERERGEELARARASICRAQFIAIESLLKRAPESRPGELMVAVTIRATDHAILESCLGSEYPVPLEQADWCHISRGEEQCYLEPAKRLLDLYRKRWGT